ncbi:hypothetical protein HDU93_004374 [Gonapodya sp. JEL0774]|nr:hypothetical protein HDU93_004374 [Gonapodya sp. JEL0774]
MYLWLEAPDVVRGVENVGKSPPKVITGGVLEDATELTGMSPLGGDSWIESDDPFVICMVTCYSEGEAIMKSTLDSVALSNYHDYRKLLFVICDGIVTGSGESRPTSEIMVGLMREFTDLGSEPKSYIAIGKGSKQENMARVHAGIYSPAPGRNIPIIAVVKCGTEEERTSKKPGNRGKRDSQMILINFLSKVLFDDSMTPLEHDLYRKITILTGVTPDFYELVMTVDADTRVKEDAMRYLVQAMKNDAAIMGCCGETKVLNKFATWVSAIQGMSLVHSIIQG